MTIDTIELNTNALLLLYCCSRAAAAAAAALLPMCWLMLCGPTLTVMSIGSTRNHHLLCGCCCCCNAVISTLLLCCSAAIVLPDAVWDGLILKGHRQQHQNLTDFSAAAAAAVLPSCWLMLCGPTLTVMSATDCATAAASSFSAGAAAAAAAVLPLCWLMLCGPTQMAMSATALTALTSPACCARTASWSWYRWVLGFKLIFV
jgi:hypothetical protein